MSAPAQSEFQPAAPEKKGKPPKAPKAPRVPKPKKPRQPRGVAPWLMIFALLLAGAAGAVLYYPIPGLTATPPAPPAAEDPSKSQTPAPTTADPALTQDLAQKEADLAAREEVLKQKEIEVDRLLKELGVTESESASLRRAANVYTKMAPFKAAPLMAQLDDATAIQVLRLMSDAEAAAILSYMEADRAARIMRELTNPPVAPAGG